MLFVCIQFIFDIKQNGAGTTNIDTKEEIQYKKNEEKNCKEIFVM